MSDPLDDLMQKDNNQTTDLEFAVIVLSEIRPEEAEKAAAELAQLRADLQAARNIINDYRNLPIGPKGYTSMPLFDLHNAADVWLAANPAPQEPQP